MENALLTLKQQLSEEIQKDNSDYNIILYLSNEIAKLDESNVRFSIDAGLINRLGKELVGKHETAVSELVKNAYDADATETKLVFKNAWAPGGTLLVIDNGVGMNKEQLINGFMRLSSSDKIHHPKSPSYNRTRAGRKGIGRFATQRLGEKLTIITQTSQSSVALKVTINWNLFESDIELNSIANTIEFIPKDQEEGTTLIIENLREGWSDAMIKRVYRYTSDLLQPFPLSHKRKHESKNNIDPGFSSSYYRESITSENKIIDEEEAFLKYSLAIIEGYVLDNGQGCYSLKSDKLEFLEEVFLIGKDKDLPDSKFEHINGVHFKCYYFIYESSLLPPQTLSFIREVANERGGIRLYRNGFRVLPYGEKLNDWLGLDDSTARRVILSSHRNINFFGFVELNDDSGVTFEETSSREGLLENDAFNELVDFTSRSIISAVQRIALIRGKKATTSQKNYKKENPTITVDNTIKEIENLFEESSNENQNKEQNKGSDFHNNFKELIEKLVEGREEEKQKHQALIDENNMLRILAGLGLVIGEFVHEVKRFLPGFNTDTTYLKNVLKDYSEAQNRVKRLETNIKSFSSYTSYFDKAISRNVLRELEPIELRDAINDFKDVVQNDLDRSGIILQKPIYEDFDLITTPMHPSEWASILFNFYTNSKKAIRRIGHRGKLLIKCGRTTNDNLFLEFSDNGDGISKGKEDSIFEAFYTTSSVASHQSNELESMTGTGLGLKIVKDIIESYGGTVYVVSPEDGYSTTIRLEIPKNSNINEYEQN